MKPQAHRTEPLNWTQLLVAVGGLIIASFFVVLGLWLILSALLSALDYIPAVAP